MSRRFIFYSFVSAVVLLFLAGAHIYTMPDIYASVWSDFFWTASSLATGLLCLRAARNCDAREVVAWHFFAAASFSWFVGMVIWSWLELVERQSVPFPAYSDVFFLMFAPLFGCGLWQLRAAQERSETGYFGRLLDLGLVASATALVVVFMFYPYLVEQREPTLYLVAALSYPVLYLSVAFLGIYRAWTFFWGSKRRVFGLLLMGFLIHAATDTVYAHALLGRSYRVGDFIDVAWLLGFAMIAAAAVEAAAGVGDSRSSEAPETGSRRSYLKVYEPLIFLIPAFLVMAAFLVTADKVDLTVAPVVFPLIFVFLLLTSIKEIRSRQVEYRLFEEKSTVSDRLSENERKLREIAETTYDCIWETDENHRFRSIIGRGNLGLTMPVEAFLGKTRWRAHDIDPNLDDNWRRHIRDLNAHRRFRDFEFSVTNAKGEPQSWSVSGKPKFDRRGDFAGYIGSARDITEKKHLEKEVETAGRQLEELISIAPEAVIIVEQDMRIRLFNTGAQRIFGYAQSEVLGKPMEMLMPKRFHKAHDVAVEGFCRSGERYRLMDARQEVVGLRKDGREFPAAASVSRNTIDEQTYFTVMLQDTTERRAAEAARRKALGEAERANRAKSEFMASMSHELRTPLNSVLGFAAMISNQYLGPVGDDRYVKYADDITFSARHLLELVNQILDIERIEAGKYQMKMGTVDMADLLAECSKLVENRATVGEVSLEFDRADDIAPFDADRRALFQVLVNLVTNAIKFTPKNGRVRVTASQCDQGIRIDVVDNGIGIPETKLDTILEPFARHESDPLEPQEGVGLGLAISNALVKLHGGRLDIRSEPGVGTTVTVTLPVRSDRPVAPTTVPVLIILPRMQLSFRVAGLGGTIRRIPGRLNHSYASPRFARNEALPEPADSRLGRGHLREPLAALIFDFRNGESP